VANERTLFVMQTTVSQTQGGKWTVNREECGREL
jgi:hypothetical protein